MTVEGQGFAAAAADNRVYFDGLRATVVSASATRLVVQPSLTVPAARHVAVSVEVASQVSNGHAFEVVPPGTTRVQEALVPSVPVAAVSLGGELYIANGDFARSSAGLYRRDATGTVARVLDTWSVPFSDPMFPWGRLYDAPVALATDGQYVYVATAIGRVYRYDPATGAAAELFYPWSMDGGSDGGAFPAVTGMAMGPGGLYVVRRSGGAFGTGSLLRIAAPDGSTEPTLSVYGDASLGGAWGVAASSDALFVTTDLGNVVRIASPAGPTPVYTPDFVEELVGPRGVAVAGGLLHVSLENGELRSYDVATGVPTGAPTTLLYAAQSMWGASDGALYAAQPGGACVRRIPAGGSAADAVIVAAGMRPALGTVRVGSATYFAASGPMLFEGGPPDSLSDATLLEVGDAGTSRLLATSRLFTGLAARDGKLYASDCAGGRIVEIVPSTGARQTVLSAFTHCPAGLTFDPAGNLYYLDADPGGGSTDSASVGRFGPAGNTPALATGFPVSSLFLSWAGNGLVLSSVFGDASPVYWVPATGGTTRKVLVPAWRTGGIMSLATAPGGELFAARMGGFLARIDPATGATTEFAMTLLRPLSPSAGGPQSSFLSMGFFEDGTFTMYDWGQAELLRVAP